MPPLKWSEAALLDVAGMILVSPADVRRAALSALLETCRVAGELLQRRAFTTQETASLGKYVSAQNAEFMQAAESASRARPDE